MLRGLRPNVASFYILTPIPGTEQYDDFLGAGWITEQNLDRFDGTTTTWRHPNVSWPELQALLFQSYRKFYDMRHILYTAMQGFHRDAVGGLVAYLGHPLFSRLSAAKGRHPMSGGIGRVDGMERGAGDGKILFYGLARDAAQDVNTKFETE